MYITKQQELEALEKIEKILEPFDENTYLGTAFKFETPYGESPMGDARRNYNEDACLSMADRLTSARKRIDELTGELIMVREQATARIRELEEKNHRLETDMANMQGEIWQAEEKLQKFQNLATQREEERDAMADSYTQLQSDYEAQERRVRELEDKSIRLKAKLYDMMTAKEVR